MKYATAAAFRNALEQRLLTLSHSGDAGIPLARLRKLVVFDRLMARLLVSAGGRWVLKGGVALNLRVGPRFRTTKDMDLGRTDGEQAATADLLTAQSLDLGDHFQFEVARTTRLDSMVEGAALRYHVNVELAGRLFEKVIVDVGFGNPPLPSPEFLLGPDLLAFADIAPIQLPVLPLELHVAEKLHAYTRSYAGGRTSSRVKDLVDLVVISKHFAFSEGQLTWALQSTFDARATHSLPDALARPPDSWEFPYRRMAAEADLESNLVAGHRRAATFLDPLLGGQLNGTATWEPLTGEWRWG